MGVVVLGHLPGKLLADPWYVLQGVLGSSLMGWEGI